MTDNDTMLPMRTPQLELLRGSAGDWLVSRVETALKNEILGAFAIFTRLADEALEGGAPLRGVELSLTASGQRRNLRADVIPSELDGAVRVQFFLHRPEGDVTITTRFHDLVGASAAMQEVYRKIRLYAASDAAVVITGETGTGKELVARAIHNESARRDKPYVAINCSAIAEQLLESELFGHEKGAFTGAIRSHRGRFERADGGSLFLDEIGDMPLHTQTRLLRVLEERCVEPLGSEQVKPVDVRVICATNVGLEQAVGQGKFRSDLYHRISVLRIHLPPLRERLDDIPLLVEAFLQQLSQRYQRRVEKLTPDAIKLLQAYIWPGNVRELRNVMERVFVENYAPVIGARAFAEWVRERHNFSTPRWDEGKPQPAPALITPYPSSAQQRQLDRETIRRALAECDNNLSAAARKLGVHRATLYRHLQRLGLKRDEL